MATLDQVAGVVPPKVELSPAERDAILEIAYLAIAADRVLRDEEVEAFRAVAARLYGLETLDEKQLGALLDRFTSRLEHTKATMIPGDDADEAMSERSKLLRAEADERLRVLAKDLPREETRTLAYKIAYALALCDLETTDEEFEFDLQLVDALALSGDQAGELADEVVTSFGTA
ncbi:MAG TPA: hypothetical protein VF407_00835 [Polyangiaceae bacterium]